MSHDIPQTSDVSDLEIVADLFRLARSGRFRKVEPLMQEALAMHPLESLERIKKCLGQLAYTFRATDYGGYNSLKRPRSRKAA